MQNKGAIWFVTILLSFICAYQLAFTFKAKSVEKKAQEYGQGDAVKEQFYLDSIASEPVYSFLGIRDYTYNEVKELEMNLGLDLKGGMNVTLEVSVVDLIKSLSNYSNDETFLKALALAQEKQRDSQDDFVTLFGEAFEEVDANAQLAAIFNTQELGEEGIKFNSTNEEVMKVIREQTDAAIDNSFNILRSRIDRFGVAQPNIQKLQTKGRILVELPGIKNPARVRKLLQGTAQLEFWETYENTEILPVLYQANQRLAEINKASKPAKKANEKAEKKAEEGASEENSLINQLEEGADSTDVNNAANMEENFPLFAKLQPLQQQNGQPYPGCVVGYAHMKDTAAINAIFKMDKIKALLPRTLKLAWDAKSMNKEGNIFQLNALKVTGRDGRAPLDGDVITDARQDFGQSQASPEISMTMNAEGAKVWKRMTRENVGKCIAIVLDGYVQSAPRVNGEIPGGRSQITGNYTINEAKDLANMLKSGKLPAPARIMQEEMVGPTLGKESIQSGFMSFIIAFALILVYMLFFYSKKAGTVANIALITNLFLIIGVMASFGAVLTLPGIAGIVLTIGMSVDANVLIYERINEEMRAGKGLRLAITDGYKNALSAIIDGQVTTLLTGIVLYMFGSGPIKGFATTLIIGIITSLWCAIFITRAIFERWMEKKDGNITFVSKATKEWLMNANVKFLEKRKTAYMISGVAILICLASLAFKGLNYSIDFQGGRTYVVRFDETVKVDDVSKSLAAVYGENPEVKTFGGDNQVRITTTYRIDENGTDVDTDVETKLYEGTKQFLASGVSKDKFLTDYRISSQKVGPTISDDIKKDSVIAIFFALVIIFLYILIRFSTWQYGVGAIAALAHDTIIVLGLFSILDGVLPFSLDIDQAFIAAILTVLGYSINDTVVVFDRIREYLGLHPKQDRIKVTDEALNSTLRRTFSTSLSTFVVLLAIFLFGGTSIKGFTFALLVGVLVGTYSSLFIATPIAHDLAKKVKAATNAKAKAKA